MKEGMQHAIRFFAAQGSKYVFNLLEPEVNVILV
jgi:hypothetical protein